MATHFETTTSDGAVVNVTIINNITIATIDHGPDDDLEMFAINVPGRGSIERYSLAPGFRVQFVVREYVEPGEDEAYDSEEFIYLYIAETGIGFEWRLGDDQFSKWDRIAEPETPNDATTVIRERTGEAAA